MLVVVWSAGISSNPLYVLRNTTLRTILCRQPLHDDAAELDEDGNLIALHGCATNNTDDDEIESGSGLECGADLGPIIKAFLGLEHPEEFVWILKPGASVCFGFDDPEKNHLGMINLFSMMDTVRTVSYTHLTLPTIYSV